MTKKKALILGGAGFIGTYISQYLVRNRDYDITIADKEFSRDLDFYFDREEQRNIKFIRDDFENPAAYKKLDRDYDYVYMLASIVGVNPTLEYPEKVIRTNTNLILNTLDWLENTSVKKLLFSSSSECYAGTTEHFDYAIPTDENVPLCIDDVKHPRFTYAITKILGESAFLNFSKKRNFESTIVRYQNAFGPDMGFKHAIPHIIERFCKGESPYRIYGNKQTRAFCYVSDAAEGTVLAMESKNSNGEIYHIGSMDEISMETLTRFIGDTFCYHGDYISEPTYPGSVSRRCPDISKAEKELDYKPKVNWQEGLLKTIEWYKIYFESGKSANDGGGFLAPENLSLK